MTAQVPDLFEWEGQVLPVCAGCAPPLRHPDIEACEIWWTPESGRVHDEVTVASRQKFFDERTALKNEKRRAAGLPEVARTIASRYWVNSTDCYRDYIATFAVREGELVLAFIQGNHRLRDGKPVKVPYTGRFSLGTGQSQFAAWEPVHEHHVYLDFVEGRLQSVTTD